MNRKCGEFTCPVEATIQLIGGKYKSVILWHLMGKTLRYSEIHKLMPKATDKMLAQQLRELERDGLVYSQRTTGRFVTEDQAMIASAKRSLAERHIQAFLEAMTHLGYGREEILTLLRQEETKGGEDNGSSGM